MRWQGFPLSYPQFFIGAFHVPCSVIQYRGMRPLPVTFHYPLIPLCSGSGSPYCEPDEKCGCFEYWMERNVHITRLINSDMETPNEYSLRRQREVFGFNEKDLEKDPITGLTESQWSKIVYALVLASLFVVFVLGLIQHNPFSIWPNL